jgi:hypothetical protein
MNEQQVRERSERFKRRRIEKEQGFLFSKLPYNLEWSRETLMHPHWFVRQLTQIYLRDHCK